MIEVLNPSTMFVRTGLNSQSQIEQFGSSYSVDDEQEAKKVSSHQKITLDTSSHTALPIFAVPTFIGFNFESVVILPEVIIPQLNPPVSNLKRPPIS